MAAITALRALPLSRSKSVLPAATPIRTLTIPVVSPALPVASATPSGPDDDLTIGSTDYLIIAARSTPRRIRHLVIFGDGGARQINRLRLQTLLRGIGGVVLSTETHGDADHAGHGVCLQPLVGPVLQAIIPKLHGEVADIGGQGDGVRCLGILQHLQGGGLQHHQFIITARSLDHFKGHPADRLIREQTAPGKAGG